VQGEIRTPDQPRKPFGAALPLQIVDGEGGILLPLCSLDSPRFFQCCHLFFCYYRKFTPRRFVVAV
jgi:hypothetical protein